MKRFYVTAAIAASILATGCQKTYVIDEVRTPIGFSTEVGKQTKAIVDNSQTYPDNQPFGVFAYGLTDNKTWDQDKSNAELVMENVKISKQPEEQSGVWKANDGNTYYWPNDPETTLSFFAYSPYSVAASTESGVTVAGMGVTPTFSDVDGIKLTNYTHEKYQGNDAVDFMVAETLNQKYSGTTGTTNGKVDIKFNHKMTQIIFWVKKATTLQNATEETGVVLKLKSITLNGIDKKADFANDTWTISDSPTPGDYTIYTNAGEEIKHNEDPTLEGIKSTAVTMIPQELAASSKTVTIEYAISGKGVATETVTKTVALKAGTVTSWDKNQKITYNITINMNEITFAPTVVDWTSGDILVPAN